ncbi:hypothetical protein C8R47DRAFT_1074251 [Mycena vitilis]|nr:hypothetical protein C8R47DRAFT_1074251 [Mycena vitilis]
MTNRDSAVAPYIFPHIKTVHISFKNSEDIILDLLVTLVDFLCALPNLTGLRIYDLPHSPMLVSRICFAFDLLPASFPAITSMLIPYHLVRVLESFPNIRIFAAPMISARVFAEVAEKRLPYLYALAGLQITQDSKALIDGISRYSSPMYIYPLTPRSVDLARIFPRLHTLSVSSPFRIDARSCLELLNSFEYLSELALVHEERSGFLRFDALIEEGKKVLMASQSPEKKVLRVWSVDTYQIIHVECC